jgi:hypoxanthine phosphoribosyltransferase
MALLKSLISEDKIKKKVIDAAKRVSDDFQGAELIILMVMKGAICLAADLMRHIDVPFTIESIRASSYGLLGTQRGKLHIKGLEEIDVRDKNVLVVDDIFHTGHTLSVIIEELKKQAPKKVASLVLLFKQGSQEVEYVPDYVLFEIGDEFVVGYGLDYKEHYRGLPGIFAFKEEV